MKVHIALCIVLWGLSGALDAGQPVPERQSGPVASAPQAVNRVLRLDGKTACVQVPDSESLHSIRKAITIEAQLQASSFYTGDHQVNSLLRKNVAANSENFLLRFRTLEGRPVVEMSPGQRVGILRAPYPFAIDRWYHVAGVYDGQSLAVYVNGEEVSARVAAGPIQIDKSDLFIGKGDPDFSSGEYFDGLVDEVRIWSVVRSPEQIRATIAAPLAGTEPGLVAYWNFDEGDARDSSPHGNHGRLNGEAQVVESPRPSAAMLREQSAEPASARVLSIDKRLETLDALWKSLNAIYPALEYKGIHGREWIGPAEKRVRKAASDAEFHDALLELMARLNDTHTRIVSYPGQPRLEAPPVALNRVEGQVAVICAHVDTRLSPGDVILKVDGRPAEECLAGQLRLVCNSTERGRVREACERLLHGTPGTTVTVTVRSADGSARDVALRREPGRGFGQEPAVSARKLDNSVGYVRIARWHGRVEGREIPAEFDRILEEFKELKGIIIDVRGNGGGDDQLADQVNGRLTDKPVVSSIDLWRQAGTDTYRKTIGWVRPRGPWPFQGRVAVLIDEGCASACEHFVSGVEAMGDALLVGAPTNGAGGGPTGVDLPDGTKVRISRALGLRANGVVFEGHGIPPHILSTPTLADLRTGRDAALEIAREWLLSDRGVPTRSQPLPAGR